MSYTLKLTTESYLLTGSGQGSAMIDADVVFHPTGFPMIPARRIKGMLKESLEEILEITGKSESETTSTLTALFGKPGMPTHEGKLIFHNLMLDGWDDLKIELSTLQTQVKLDPEFIKAYFTSEIRQTALENGIAKYRSLRNYRVIDPGLRFCGILVLNESLTDDELSLVENACLNLRHAGTRRNRGFGKIRCQLLHNSSEPDPAKEHKTFTSDVSCIKYSIRLLSPVVLADLKGEQNTVFTYKYISGNQIRGLLARAFMKSSALNHENAHLDALFRDLFLSSKLQFDNGTIAGSEAIPLHIHEYKMDNTKPLISVFAKSEDDHDITRSIGGFARIEGELIDSKDLKPKTTFNFHNSRYHRATGRSREDDPETGIFYYESLNEGQVLEGTIQGDKDLLTKLLRCFPIPFKSHLGRSRSAQYGLVEVTLTPALAGTENEVLESGKYIITARTPILLFNAEGHPTPSVKELKSAIEVLWPQANISINEAATSLVEVEQYNSIWRSKSGKYLAYAEGSSFLIRIEKECTPLYSIGEWTEQGFGRLKIEPFNREQKYRQLKPETNSYNEKDQNSNSDPEFNSQILQEIYAYHKEKSTESEFKALAIRAAKGDTRKKEVTQLNNHQIGRLERLFQKSQSPEEINIWIKETKGKPLGGALSDACLVKPDHSFDMDKFFSDELSERLKKEHHQQWRVQKMFWITFFQTMRKLVKKSKRDAKR